MASSTCGSLVTISADDAWPYHANWAKMREAAWDQHPAAKTYRLLPAPTHLANGIPNDWDVDIRVSLAAKDEAYLTSHAASQQIKPDAKLVHLCLTLRRGPAVKQSVGKDGQVAKYNAMPICAVGPFVTDRPSFLPGLPGLNTVVAAVGGLESFWISLMRGGPTGVTFEHYGKYSGLAEQEGAFRPYRLVFNDATLARIIRAMRAHTKYDTTEICYSYSTAKISAPAFYKSAYAHNPGAGKPVASGTAQEHHLHSKGQPLTMCGNQECHAMGVMNAGSVDLKVLSRCLRCTVVSYCSSACQDRDKEVHKHLCDVVKSTMA